MHQIGGNPMFSRLGTTLLLACLVTTPAFAQSVESAAAPAAGETYFVQVQVVRLIPIRSGGVKNSVLVDLKRIARASCSLADARLTKNSVDIYDLQVNGREVQYSASVQCK